MLQSVAGVIIILSIPDCKQNLANHRSNKMSFDNSAFRKLVKKYGGWIESGAARFPSVHQKDQFLKAIALLKIKQK